MAILSKLAEIEVNSVEEMDDKLWEIAFGYIDLGIRNGEHAKIVELWESILGYSDMMPQVELKYMKNPRGTS